LDPDPAGIGLKMGESAGIGLFGGFGGVPHIRIGTLSRNSSVCPSANLCLKANKPICGSFKHGSGRNRAQNDGNGRNSPIWGILGLLGACWKAQGQCSIGNGVQHSICRPSRVRTPRCPKKGPRPSTLPRPASRPDAIMPARRLTTSVLLMDDHAGTS